jgi:hypothetical protein
MFSYALSEYSDRVINVFIYFKIIKCPVLHNCLKIVEFIFIQYITKKFLLQCAGYHLVLLVMHPKS